MESPDAKQLALSKLSDDSTVDNSVVTELEEEIEKDLVSDEERVEIIMLVTNDTDWAITSANGILTKAGYPYKLTLYENSLNSRNTSKIWNKLLKQSTCGYQLLIDSDAVPQTNDWLRTMVKAAKENPKAAVIVPVAGDTAVTTVQRMKPKDTPPFEVNGHISGYCMLFQKGVLNEIGYFDEDFCFYGQDSDWMERVMEADKKAIVVPDVLVTHGHYGESSISSQRFEKEGKFNRAIDSQYAKSLCELKKYERQEKK